MNCTDIFNFCLRLKVNSKSTAMFRTIRDGEVVEDKLNRTTRYYISTNGGTLYKDFGDGRQSNVNVGYGATIFNEYINKPMKDYKIDYRFYIVQAKKLVDAIDTGWRDLFE